MAQLFRPVNLFIVALTQYLLHYFALAPALSKAEITPPLTGIHFFLLVLTTVLIAAGGYIINDILDYPADLVNKPDKVVVNRVITIDFAKKLYIGTSLTGAAIALYLASFVQHLSLFLIYPAAVFLLFLYSYRLKKIPLAGNIIVALFCAGVAGIVLFAARDSYAQLSLKHIGRADRITGIFSAYVLFAFLSTLLREIIKDMEDIEGDQQYGLQTFPIVFGLRKSKILTMAVATSILVCLAYSIWWLYLNSQTISFIFLLVAILMPMIYLMQSLLNAKTKKDFSALSQLSKLVMLAGLILLMTLWMF